MSAHFPLVLIKRVCGVNEPPVLGKHKSYCITQSSRVERDHLTLHLKENLNANGHFF